MQKFKPEKAFSVAANGWWETMSAAKQEAIRQQYGQLRLANMKSKFPYPDMRDLSQVKLKDFTNKDIFCIYRFNAKYN